MKIAAISLAALLATAGSSYAGAIGALDLHPSFPQAATQTETVVLPKHTSKHSFDATITSSIKKAPNADAAVKVQPTAPRLGADINPWFLPN